MKRAKMTNLIATTLLLVSAFCQGQFTAAGPTAYSWSNVTRAANFPESYKYPVFVFGEWMVALNQGAWLSKDGKKWIKTELPDRV